MNKKKKNNSLLLSIIIPAFNAHSTIEDCLESLIHQSLSLNKYEIIVINDCSTDETQKIVERFSVGKNIRIINLKENMGVSFARNVGIKESLGKYITFVDSDDKMSPNTYGKILEIMENKSMNYFVYAFTHCEEKLQIFDEHMFGINSEKFIPLPVYTCIYLKSTITNNKILFNPMISFREDFFFNYQFLQCSNAFFNVTSQPLYFYRLSTNSTVSNLFNDIKKIERCYNSYIHITSRIKNNKNYPCFDNYLYEKALSQMLTALTWLCIRGRIKPNKLIRDLKTIHIKLIENKIKIFEGYARKRRFKSTINYYCRYEWFFFFVWFMYRPIETLLKMSRK